MSETTTLEMLGTCDARLEAEGEPCGRQAVQRFVVACVHEHVKVVSACQFDSPESGGLCRECARLPVDAHDCWIRAFSGAVR